MKFEIHVNQNDICIDFKKLTNKYNVSINYEFVNEYQLIPSKFSIIPIAKTNINSIDIRNLNIYGLTNKGFKLINNYLDIDEKEFRKLTKNKNFNKFDIKKITKDIKNKNFASKEMKFALYAYMYCYYIPYNNQNYSLYLSKRLNYSDAYIKNLTKELFNKKYLIKQGKGVPGGLFSNKLIKLFNSQEFQQYL